MKDNVIIANNGTEIYQSDIDILCDDYIATLPDPTTIYSKSTSFSGLLLYIYKHCIKQLIYNDKVLRGNTFNNNYALLNDIFREIYIPLCYKYDIEPTIVQFCFFTDIERSNLTDINNGIYRKDGSRVNPETQRTVKKWFLACEESSLAGAKKHGKIGDIFDLKSNYGYTEAPQKLEIVGAESRQSAAEIMEKYRNAELPVMPE